MKFKIVFICTAGISSDAVLFLSQTQYLMHFFCQCTDISSFKQKASPTGEANVQVQPPHTAPEMCQRYTPQKDPTLRWQGRRCGNKPHSNGGVYHISIDIVAPLWQKVNYRKGHRGTATVSFKLFGSFRKADREAPIFPWAGTAYRTPPPQPHLQSSLEAWHIRQ